MYFFLIFGLPIGFLLLYLEAYPRDEAKATGRAFARGLASFIPIWLIARILGALVPAAYGSFLQAFHEWADRLLPYAALPGLAYLVFYRLGDRLPPGAALRRLTSFYAGALAPVGLLETTRVWGNPAPYPLFLLPVLLGAICLAMPKAVFAIDSAYGLGLAARIVAAAAASLAASLGPYLFLVGLWPLALLLVAACAGGAWILASSELFRHPPTPILGE
jgi:hypothetical protein